MTKYLLLLTFMLVQAQSTLGSHAGAGAGAGAVAGAVVRRSHVESSVFIVEETPETIIAYIDTKEGQECIRCNTIGLFDYTITRDSSTYRGILRTTEGIKNKENLGRILKALDEEAKTNPFLLAYGRYATFRKPT